MSSEQDKYRTGRLKQRETRGVKFFKNNQIFVLTNALKNVYTAINHQRESGGVRLDGRENNLSV